MAEVAKADVQKAVLSPPDWLRIWRKHFYGQRWGFVAFRAACFGGDNDNDRWTEFQKQFKRIVELPFTRAITQAQEEGVLLPDDFNEARAKFEIQWVEEVPLDGGTLTTVASADSLRAKYAALRPSLDPGLCWDVFFCASPEAVESFENEASTTDETSSFWRARAPFLLAVSAHSESGLEEDHEETAWFKPVFKIAAEVLVESLFTVLDMGTPLRRITRSVLQATELDQSAEQRQKEPIEETGNLDEIWWSMHPSPARLRMRRNIGPIQ
ncbi:hypothetical protein F5Y00DRAFT_233217 [Daldinia vernicosa]|uniref:uncharacterized protein n=1 Tax=Daldinia vernicosa TaxID=114800 RepID=UPI002008DDA6|nr:uncharacterized protein F5Y00DRAFT_233217 [Daldinia vernicosa]KAI0850383.1 hypothetical protein F5Y00DRAFT_233217 [Daldinia vernicosa]